MAAILFLFFVGNSLNLELVNAQNSPADLLNQGKFLVNHGMPNEAILIYDEFLRKDPNHVSALIEKGIALKHLQKFEEARNFLDAALKLEPDNIYAKIERLDVLRHQKDHDEIRRQRRHGKVEPLDPQARQADQHAHRRRQRHRQRHRDEGHQPCRDHPGAEVTEDGHRIGTDGDEGAMAQRDQPGIAGQDVDPHHGDQQDAHLACDQDQIVVAEQGEERQCEDRPVDEGLFVAVVQHPLIGGIAGFEICVDHIRSTSFCPIRPCGRQISTTSTVT